LARLGATTSTDVDAPQGRQKGVEVAWLRRFTPLLEAVVVLSIWLMNRFYRGIVHDSRIYIGRALADLDPQGLGREPTFLYDHQTQNSIFPHLITPLVRAFGPSATSMGVALAALLIWLAAAAWLASRMMPRRLVPAALICAALLPAFYGPFDIFSFGEALATPRGFAEAGVLAGLAALLGGRRILCGGLLLLAALFHPVMAAPGFGVAFLILATEDRRWWGLAPLGLIGLIAAGALHLGPAKALFSVYDPEWLRVLHVRDHFLFLADWPSAAWYDAALALTTVALAAMVLKGRRRVVAVAALIGAAASLAASFVFGDLLGSMLIVQLQLWRALWIVQVLAVLLIPTVAVEFWATGRRDARLAMVLMGLSWLDLNGTLGVLPALAAALGCSVVALSGGVDRVSAKGLAAVSIAAVAFVFAAMGVSAYTGVALIQSFAPLHTAPPFHFLLALNLHRFPILAIALAPLLFPMRIHQNVRAIGLALSALVLVPLTVLTWDQRTPTRRMIDRGQGRAELNALIGPKSGTGVVWIPDEVAPWFLLSRATWVSDLQGTLGAFSRPLIMGWDLKANDLVASGLDRIRNRAPWAQTPVARARGVAQSRDNALRLCAVKGGPQAIVLAGDLAKRFATGVAATWRAPVTDVMLAPGSLVPEVMPFNAYTIVRCDRISSPAVQQTLTSIS